MGDLILKNKQQTNMQNKQKTYKNPHKKPT